VGVAPAEDLPKLNARRTAVYRELRRGLDFKLMMSGSGDALGYLEHALHLATTPTPLQWPTPQVVAYRLAHLLLRSARSETELRRIEALLVEANRGNEPIGALPGCMHLAVLHRLRAMGCADFDLKLAAGITALIEQVRSPRYRVHKDAGNAQHHAINLVELSFYFIGANQSSLEGVGVMNEDPHAGLGGGEAWVLIGTSNADATIRMPRHLAEEALRVHERDGLADLTFVLDSAASCVRVGGVQVKTPAHAPRLLALLCHGAGPETLVQAFTANVYHKTVERTRMTLAEPLGRSHDDIIKEGDPYQFAPGLRVMGAVPRAIWMSRNMK